MIIPSSIDHADRTGSGTSIFSEKMDVLFAGPIPASERLPVIEVVRDSRPRSYGLSGCPSAARLALHLGHRKLGTAGEKLGPGKTVTLHECINLIGAAAVDAQ